MSESLVSMKLEFSGEGIEGHVIVHESQFISMKISLKPLCRHEGVEFADEDITVEVDAVNIKIKHEYELGRSSWTDTYFNEKFVNEYHYKSGNMESPTNLEEKYIQSQEWTQKWLTNKLSIEDVKQFIRELAEYYIPQSNNKKEKVFDNGVGFAKKVFKYISKKADDITSSGLEPLRVNA